MKTATATVIVNLLATDTMETLPATRRAVASARFERLYREHTGDALSVPRVLEIDTDTDTLDALDDELREGNALGDLGGEVYVLLLSVGARDRDVWARAKVVGEGLPLAPYRVTFRIGGWDAPERHRIVAVLAGSERAAPDAAAARVWGETAHWRAAAGSDTYGAVWRHASRGGSRGGGWDAMTHQIGASVACG